MADVVKFLDGSTEVVLTEPCEFLERRIREKLGEDAVRIFTDIIDEFKDDLQGWEAQAEHAGNIADDYLAMCHDTEEGLQLIKKLVQAPRIDKISLLHAINAEIEKLNSELKGIY